MAKELLTISLKSKQKKELKRKAKKAEETISEYVRKIIDKHFEEEKNVWI